MRTCGGPRGRESQADVPRGVEPTGAGPRTPRPRPEREQESDDPPLSPRPHSSRHRTESRRPCCAVGTHTQGLRTQPGGDAGPLPWCGCAGVTAASLPAPAPSSPSGAPTRCRWGPNASHFPREARWRDQGEPWQNGNVGLTRHVQTLDTTFPSVDFRQPSRKVKNQRLNDSN